MPSGRILNINITGRMWMGAISGPAMARTTAGIAPEVQVLLHLPELPAAVVMGAAYGDAAATGAPGVVPAGAGGAPGATARVTGVALLSFK
jgi:hypothetical protein